VHRTTLRSACGALLFSFAVNGCTILSQSGGPHTAHDLAMAPAPPVVAAPTPPRELIQIRDQIRFDFDSDHIQHVSESVLAEVAREITQNPEIRRVRVEGNTDQRGAAEHNTELSTRRAAAVAEWLRAHGVTIQIESAGRGQSNPLCTQDTEECYTRNRRVEFVIVERATPSATPTVTPSATPSQANGS
jgi:OOP family OmpA-OmpF porin